MAAVLFDEAGVAEAAGTSVVMGYVLLFDAPGIAEAAGTSVITGRALVFDAPGVVEAVGTGVVIERGLLFDRPGVAEAVGGEFTVPDIGARTEIVFDVPAIAEAVGGEFALRDGSVAPTDIAFEAPAIIEAVGGELVVRYLEPGGEGRADDIGNRIVFDGSLVFTQNDTGPLMRFVLTGSDGSPLSLVGATCRLSMIRSSGRVVVRKAPMVLEEPALGAVRYSWRPGDLPRPGRHRIEVEVTYADGSVETFPTPGVTPLVVEGEYA